MKLTATLDIYHYTAIPEIQEKIDAQAQTCIKVWKCTEHATPL